MHQMMLNSHSSFNIRIKPMAITSKTFVLIGALLSLLGLAGCRPAGPTIAPTIDTDQLRTEVAATVLAQVTQDLALTPSVTLPPAPTATLPPTSTHTQATIAPSTEVVTVTATLSSSTPEAETENQAGWVSQSIADKTVFAPGETFTMTWRLKNTGTSTWATDYVLRFYSGDPFGLPDEVLLNREVPPGETVDIILQMKAPATPGTYTTVWVMSTANRSNFKEPVYLEIVVAGTATPTPTP
jgi:hypothetical protein